MAEYSAPARRHNASNEHAMNHATARPTPMGYFDKLPAELRIKIYTECARENMFDQPLLKVNNQFHTEYLEVLQKHRGTFGTLHLHIDPSQHPSAIQVLTQYGRLLKSIDAASSHLQYDTNPIRSLPIGLYNQLKVRIYPPDPKDPGQAIRLCKQIFALTTSLSASWYPSTCLGIPTREADCVFPARMEVSEFLPRIQVSLEEEPHRSWSTDNRWNKSLRDYDQGWDNERLVRRTQSLSDVGLVLQLLQHLRRVDLMRIRLPGRPDLQLRKLCRKVETLAQDSIDFGLKWCRGHRCREDDGSDHDILAKIQSLQVWHEFLLDDLPGRAANLLRQERFLKWCTAYERQHAQALRGVPARCIRGSSIPQRSGLHIAGAREWLDWDLWVLICSSFHSRFWARMTCDLGSPSGVERKSENKVWTQFPERPKARFNTFEGFDVSTDCPAVSRGPGCSAKCATCTTEDEKNRSFLLRKDALELSIKGGMIRGGKVKGWNTDGGDNGLWDTGVSLGNWPLWVTGISLRRTVRTSDGWWIGYDEVRDTGFLNDDELNPPEIWSFTYLDSISAHLR